MQQVKTLKDLEKLIDRVHVAQKEYADFSESKKLKILFSNPFVLLAFGICIYHIVSSTIDFINSCSLL